MLQSARRLDLTGDYGRAMIRKITWAAPYRGVPVPIPILDGFGAVYGKMTRF
jgi:hypothetical protein